MRYLRLLVPVIAGGLVFLAGCQATGTVNRVQSDPSLAVELDARACELAASDAPSAERLLREAIACDPFYGPAHNNLGVVLMDAGELAEAAQAFESARKLMPGRPGPRRNLGLVFERAGRIDDALDAYRAALEVSPDDVVTMQAIVRLQLRSGRTDEHTDALLEEIALRGEDSTWREWARRQEVLQ